MARFNETTENHRGNMRKAEHMTRQFGTPLYDVEADPETVGVHPFEKLL
jgi:hypothetical protein